MPAVFLAGMGKREQLASCADADSLLVWFAMLLKETSLAQDLLMAMFVYLKERCRCGR